MRNLRVGSCLLSLIALAACSQGSESGDVQGAPEARIAEIFSEFTVPGSPGAVAMVIRNGEVIHAEGYGLAEVGSGRALSRHTPMRLGSVGKQFTSMAVMILADRGELAFDDAVTEWVPELRRFPGIQVQHLLRHTSGLPDYYDLPEEDFVAVAPSDGDPVLTNVDVVTHYEHWGEPLFEPGERFQYSNPGYEVLALIVERISGQSFGRFLAENIFEPLGMEMAAVRERPDTEIPGRGVGYRPERQGEGWMENDDHYGNWLVGAGGIYASLDDLYLWDQALYTEALVKKETLDLAFSPTILNDGSISDYGFGWNVGDRLGHKAVHHGGSWVGFRAAILRFVDEELTVVVVSNASASAGDLADQVAELFL
jgi:CubicO group peptidase (beta-lactamase class C family)